MMDPSEDDAAAEAASQAADDADVADSNADTGD
jgi:hypothetical protein